ncbi:MAG: hypothetical protein WA738_12445 [Candidatus Angelobacter sp.]
MKPAIAVTILSICGFGLQGAQSQSQKSSAKAAPLRSFTGVITDGQCAGKGSHKEVMKRASVNTEANCVRGCARRYGYVLYGPASKKVYKLNDDLRLAQMANQRVSIKGTVDKSTQTIFVSSIELAK